MEHIAQFQVTAAIATLAALAVALLVAIRGRQWVMPIRHAAAAVSMWLLVWLFISLRPGMEGVHLWNRAFADASLVLIGAVMMVGPLARLWHPFAKAIPWRREFGVWGTVAATTHVSIYWHWVYDWAWQPFFYAFQRVRFDGGSRVVVGDELGRSSFAIANDVGLIALIYGVVLALTSNDFSIKILGKAWPWLMSKATTFWLLCLLHTWIFVYLVYAGTKIAGPLLWTVFTSVLALQLAGFVKTIWRPRPAKST